MLKQKKEREGWGGKKVSPPVNQLYLKQFTNLFADLNKEEI